MFGICIADDDDDGIQAKFPDQDSRPYEIPEIASDRNCEVFLSFKSIRTPVAVLLLLTQTVNAQQGRQSTASTPLTSTQMGGHTMRSSRYPVQPASFQPEYFDPVAGGDQMPQNYYAPGPQPIPRQFQPSEIGTEQFQPFPQNRMLPPPSQSGPSNSSEYQQIPAADLRWSFNFQQAPWPIVLRTFAREAGFSLQMAVEPQGDFTYFDENRYPVTEALDIFNDNLMTMGQIIVRDGNRLTLLHASAEIPGNIIPFVPIHGIDALGRNELATVAIPLRNTDPIQALEEIGQLQSPLGQVKALTNSGRVIVTDTGSYLRRMRDLLLGSGVAAGDGQAYVYQLRHAQAEEVAKAITDFLSQNGGVIASGGEGGFSNGSSDSSQRVVAEKTTNSLLVRGTSDEMATIQRIIEELDRAPREVLVQALLVEVELGNTNELGVELGFQDSVLFDRSVVDKLVTISQTTTAPNGTQTTNQNIVSRTAAPGFNFNNQPLGNNVAANPSHVAGQSLSSFGVGRVNGDLGFGGLVLSAGSESVNILLRALDAQYNVDVLSRPQVRAVENHQAFIQIGQQVPVVDGVSITPVGTANPVIRQDQAGIILKVTPRISPDGRVQLDVNAEKSHFNLTPGTGVPIFTDATNGNVIEAPIKDITTADTTVSIQSGQTIVLGGMITNDQAMVTRKVPWLGDIPFIGRLFRYDLNRHKRKELLVFLTPIVLENDGHNEYLKSKETGLINMPAEAFSFGDNLTGHYDNSANAVVVRPTNDFNGGVQTNGQDVWQHTTTPSQPGGEYAVPLSEHPAGVQQVSSQASGGRHSFQNGNATDESSGVRSASYQVIQEEPSKRPTGWGHSPNFRGFLSRKKPEQKSEQQPSISNPAGQKPTPQQYSASPISVTPSNRYR